MKSIARLCVLAALLFVLGYHSDVNAAITVQQYYRLGENDPGAANGNSAAATLDFISGQSIQLTGSPIYTTIVSSLATAGAGSTLAMNFSTSGQYGSRALISADTDNFGFELWVQPVSTVGTQCLAYNGDPGGSGWGLLIIDGTYQVLFGNVAFFGSAPATAGAWTHLAVVVDSGVSTFYVNGAAAATLNGGPNAPQGSFTLATTPPNPDNFFTGLMDEARLFTFAPGQFSTNDLTLTPQVFITTGAATNVTDTSAGLQATLYPGTTATAYFQYGLTTNYGSLTGTFTEPAGTSNLLVTTSISGLLAGSTYHFRAVATNSVVKRLGDDLTFTTAGGVPQAATLTAFGITTNQATLNGTANPNGAGTTVYFAYGLTTSYGTTNLVGNIGNGSNAVSISRPINSLIAGATYHYRLFASNSIATASGNDVTFSTVLPFTNVLATGLTNRSDIAAWGDYDNDGKLDLLFNGWNGSSNVCQLWHNNGNDTFSLNTAAAGLPALVNSAIAWGDYDNDGWLDFAVIGQSNGVRFAQVWRNLGNNAFTNINAGITGVAFGSVAWGDYNNDGRLDLALCGHDGTNYVTQVWRNNGNGTFSNLNAGLPPLRDGCVRWADYNGDGFADLLLSGQSNGVPVCQIWRNVGNGTFTNINAGLTGVWRSAVAWGDYDNDGKLDVLLSGASANDPLGGPTNAVCQIWRNVGNGVFTNINAGLPGVFSSSVAWGDYESSGKLAVLLTGITNSLAGAEISQLWRQTATGFTNSTLSLTGVNGGTGAWGDFNNDGRLDFILAGPGFTQIWKNQTGTTNQSPTAPSGLTATLTSGSSVLLSWNAATDPETPASGLTYNVRVGTNAGGGQILSALANATNGFRRVPQLGNASQRLSTMVTNLTSSGAAYYWSVQAVDTALAGSAFAPEVTFAFSAPLATTLGATTVQKANATLNGTVNPNGLPTTGWFEWGTTTNYGNRTMTFALGNGTTILAASNALSGLNFNSLYHFRCVATNGVGMGVGQDFTFTTLVSDVTPLHYYHLGENDPGAAAGGTTASTRDSIGTQHLSVFGSPAYAADVSSLATQHADSSLSLNFSNGASYATGPLVSTLTDNFGFEVWVKPTSASSGQFIAYNGDPGYNGWGILQDGNAYRVLFGGTELFGSGSVTLNQWTHVAVVRDNGTAALYVNGIATDTTTSLPGVPAGGFSLASAPDASGKFAGLMDEARFFTFAPGSFDTNELLLNVSGLPSFENVAATATSPSGATLNAKVHPGGINAAAWFEFGQTTNYGSFTSTNAVPIGAALNFNKAVSGLVPGSFYHFRIGATNSFGRNTSPDSIFFTAALPQVTTLPAINIGATNATLLGSVDPGTAATTVYFQYGATTNYDSVSALTLLSAGSGAQSVSNLLTGLPIVSTVHFRVVATNNAGTNFGADLSFTTLPLAPQVTTLAAFAVRSQRATLNGSINPNGANSLAWFEYGLTTNYGSFSATSSVPAGASLAFSNLVSGLSSNSIYHFRAAASNSVQTAYGADLTFATPLVSVTNFAYYRLGEADPGAAAGQSPANSLDSAGTHNLTVAYAPGPAPGASYSSDVAPGAAQRAGSSLSLDVHNGYATTASILSSATDNFALEVWAKPTGSAGTQIIAYNGQPTLSGWGIERVGNTVVAVFGDNDHNPAYPGGLPVTVTVGSSPVVLDQWTHFALVRNNGTATFYVNGVPSGSTTTGGHVSTARFALSAYPGSFSQGRFSGWVDEARIFTFAPGAFDP
ncbi:MAG: Fibronectin type domain protein, partial [Pedosphaera sp.]|nr:Fibronectin type domain protein [Pedosphaera sp.]